MPTIQQHIFPPKPKGTIITPLSPRPKNVPTDVTPLSRKQDIQDAIDAREVDPVIPEIQAPVASKPKVRRTGNALLGGTKA